ncbi:hypothetical protein T492DRAFT_912444, partial [Pavlovales sp. CCMP2436]
AFLSLKEKLALSSPPLRARVEPLAVCFFKAGASRPFSNAEEDLALGSTFSSAKAFDLANSLETDLLCVVVPPPSTGEVDTPVAEAARALQATRDALGRGLARLPRDCPVTVWLPETDPGVPEALSGRLAFPALAAAVAAAGGSGAPLALATEVRKLRP